MQVLTLINTECKLVFSFKDGKITSAIECKVKGVWNKAFLLTEK